jgi:hypothetical protein
MTAADLLTGLLLLFEVLVGYGLFLGLARVVTGRDRRRRR